MLNLICGDVGSGKTSECIRKMQEIRAFKPDAQIYLIVPEQYSFLAEKLIVEKFGGNGINGIDVLTFSKMAKRFLHNNPKKYLDKSGKSILVTKAIETSCDENSIYYGCAKKVGFSNSVSHTFSDFKKYLISPQLLYDAASKTENKIFSHKLNSLAKIYERYNELNDERFLDFEKDLLRLSESILTKNLFSDSYVFIDEFADFMPQHYKVICALMKNCVQLYVTLPINENKDSDVFNLPLKTQNTLINLAKKNKVPYDKKYFDKNGLSFISDEIKFLFDNYTTYNSRNFKQYQDKTNDIYVFSALDKYSEVEYVAKRITALVSDKHIRYSDITVACADKEAYSDIIEAIFTDYGIPYFTDTNLVVINHPVIMTVLGLFTIIAENWSIDSVFSYLKSGFVYYISDDDKLENFDADDVDFLYSYVLKRGIRGKKKWLSADEWSYDVPGLAQAVSKTKAYENRDADNRINSLRHKFVGPIEVFINKTRGRNKVSNLAEALFEFLENIHLYEGLLLEIKRLNEKGMRNEAEQFSQIWNILITVIDQVVTAIGDEYCSKDEFFNYLISGFAECEIAIIPSSLDCVAISSADEAVQKSVNTLFVLGALRGALPNESTPDDMFSKKDRQELLELFDADDIEFGRSDAEIKSAAEYRFYKMLFNANERIIVTYPVTDNQGEATVPSQIIGTLKKLFINLTIEDDLTFEIVTDDIVFSPKSAYNYLMQNRNNKYDLSVKGLYQWFSSNSEWADRLNMIKAADNYKRDEAKITKKSVVDIYSDNSLYSVSRLNEYSQCPFKYFIKNGLKAKEEDVWQIHKFDLGSLMHFAVYKFCKTIEEGVSSFDELKSKWASISYEECNKIIDSVIKEILEKISQILERDEGKINYLINRMSKTLKRSIDVVRKSLSSGEYVPVEYEKSFFYDIDDFDEKISIQGTIDRIDLAFDYDEQKAGIRVIDYKSGSKKFSVASVCNMIDIQLIVYALAAIELYKKGEIKYSKNNFAAQITAVMYNKLRDDMTKIEKILSENDINKAVNSNMKLNGPVILDNDENGDMDVHTLIMMDKNIEITHQSDFIDAKMTTKGKIDKRSGIISKDDFSSLLKYAKNNIKKHNKFIKQGDIRIMPYKEGDTLSCKYCEMSEICLFDNDRDCVRHLCTNDKLAWEIIKKDTMEQ